MKQKITEFIYAHRDEMVETLKALVKIPSVQSEKEEDAPYGKECAALLDAVSGLYAESGFPTKMQKENMYSLAYLPGGKRTIGVFAHGDVVPVGDDWTVTRPFEPIEKDGCYADCMLKGVDCKSFVKLPIRVYTDEAVTVNVKYWDGKQAEVCLDGEARLEYDNNIEVRVIKKI